MFNRLSRMLVACCSQKLGVALAAALATGLALAQTVAPSFSGPSVTRTAESATFHGGALPPNSALTVFVTSPSGSVSGYGAVSGPSGAMQYIFSATTVGAYNLVLADSGGRTLATAVIAVLP